ncbi:hypothetical protein TNCV_2062801 [Trichonephila clavipes]|nr:hypothetical protein TNCV_2062801 [Trichonephila clavipes]
MTLHSRLQLFIFNSKNQSLRGRSFTTALSNKTRITPRGFNSAPSITPSLFSSSDPLTSLIYPQMFFPFPPLSDSALLICCHSTSPIRFDTFQLKPHGRRCLGTPCVFPDALPSPDREQTKHIVDVTPRTKFRTSFPGINE